MTTLSGLPTARRGAWLPLLSLLATVILVNVVAWAIDASALEQASDSWGYAFASLLLTLYASPLALVLLGLAMAGSLGRSERLAGWCGLLGALVVAAAGFALLVLAVTAAVDEPLAGRLFSVAVATGALVLWWPLLHRLPTTRGSGAAQSLRSRT